MCASAVDAAHAGRHAHIQPGRLRRPIRSGRQALDAFCASERLPDEVAWRLRVALDEIVANIVAHGPARRRPTAIDVWFGREGGHRRDHGSPTTGRPFNPLAACRSPM